MGSVGAVVVIAPDSRAHKGKKEMTGEYGGVCGRRGMVQPSQQHVAPCVKVVEWGFGTRGLGKF